MKGCFTTLLLALLAAFIAAFFGRSLHRQGVENILNERVATRINAAYPGVEVKYDHLTAMVSGKATTTEIDEIKTKVKELALGNGRVHFDVSSPAGPTIPKAKMPSFTIFRDDGKLTLNGTVDSAQTKAILGKEALSNLGLELDNQLEIGNNTAAFPAFGAAIAAVPALMKSATNGRVEADPKKVVVSGIVESDEIKKGLLDLFAAEKWNAEIVDQLEVRPTAVVTAPPIPVVPTEPVSFAVLRINDKLTLSGTVDSPETKTLIGNAAKMEGLTIDNQIQISDKVMKFPELGSAIAGITSLISSAENGKIEVSPAEITLSGLVANSAIKVGIMDFYSAGKVKGPKIVNQIKVNPSQPSGFTIAKNDTKLTLTGTVDSPRTKNMLGNAAKAEGLVVDNQIKISEDVMAFPEFNSTIAGIPSLISATKIGKIEVSPDQVLLSGTVNNQATKDGVMGFYSGEKWKGPKIIDQISVKMPAEPPTFIVQRNNDKLTLTGTVDSEETKTMLGNAAKIEGVTVANQIKVSDEVMSFPALTEAVSGIPSLISAAENGRIDFTPEKVTLSGLVDKKGDKDGVLGNFSAEKWKGIAIVDQIKIRPPKIAPTFAWKQDTPKKAILSGRVPNAKIRDGLVDAAKKRLGPDAEVVDQIVIDPNVRNEPWLSALPVFATQAMPKIDMPIINIDDKVSTISGKVSSSTVMNDVGLAFSGINPPGKMELNLEVMKPTAPTPPMMIARTVIPDVEVTGVGQRLAVSGKIADKKTHDAIVNTILGMKDIDHLDNKLKIADNVKEENYLEPLPGFIGEFYNGSIKNREFWLKNKELTLKGVLPGKEEKAKTLALADPLKAKGVKIIDLLTVEAPKVVVMAPEPPKVAMVTPKGPDTPKVEPPAPAPPKVAMVPPKPAGKSPAAENKPAPPINPDKGELHSIYYGTGEFHIRDSQKTPAKKLLARAKETDGKIVIDGFADERGTDELNAFLSDERAKRIRNYLIENGVDQSRIVSVVGRGEIPDGKSYQEYRRTDVRILD